MKLAGVPTDDPALAPRARVHPRARRPRARGRLHAHLPRVLRPVPVVGPAGDAGRAGAAAAVVPAQHLRDVELGAGDRRAAHRADGEAAAHRHRRAECGVEELWLAPPTPERIGFPPSRELVLRAQRVPGARLGPAAARSQSVEAAARARAMRRAAEWILAHQDRNGGWGGIQPPMLNCVMALRALGYPDDHPAVANGVQAIEDFLIEHDGQLFFQPCVSPTWDTALTCKALLDSGVARDASRAGARRRVADREPDLRARRLERSQPRSSSRAAGRSSSPTTGIPTSTTPP